MVRDAIRLMEICSLLYTIAAVYGEKLRCNIYVVTFAIIELVILSGVNEYGLAPYLFCLSYILIFLYCLLSYKSIIKETLVSCVMAYMVAGLIQLASYVLVSFVLEIIKVDIVQKEFLITTISFGVVVLLVNRMHLSELKASFLKRNKLLNVVGIFTLIMLGSQIVAIKKNGVLDAKITISIIYFVLLLLFLIYEWEKARKDIERKKTQLELNKLYYDAYENLIISMRERQHDYKNHLNAIEGMLYSIDNYEELVKQQSKYLKEITGNVENERLLTMIENPLIAGFLNYKISKALGMGIKVEYNCTLKKGKIKIPEFEIVEMMGILLDNAFEAVMQDDIEQFVKIELYTIDDQMIFSVENPYNENKKENIAHFFDIGYSSKGDNRGIGLSKLKCIVSKNDGEIRVMEPNDSIGSNLKMEICLNI